MTLIFAKIIFGWVFVLSYVFIAVSGRVFVLFTPIYIVCGYRIPCVSKLSLQLSRRKTIS